MDIKGAKTTLIILTIIFLLVTIAFAVVWKLDKGAGNIAEICSTAATTLVFFIAFLIVKRIEKKRAS